MASNNQLSLKELLFRQFQETEDLERLLTFERTEMERRHHEQRLRLKREHMESITRHFGDVAPLHFRAPAPKESPVPLGQITNNLVSFKRSREKETFDGVVSKKAKNDSPTTSTPKSAGQNIFINQSPRIVNKNIDVVGNQMKANFKNAIKTMNKIRSDGKKKISPQYKIPFVREKKWEEKKEEKKEGKREEKREEKKEEKREEKKEEKREEKREEKIEEKRENKSEESKGENGEEKREENKEDGELDYYD